MKKYPLTHCFKWLCLFFALSACDLERVDPIAPESAMASFRIDNNACVAPCNPQFVNTSPERNRWTYEWDFGDGTSSSEFQPASKTYDTKGEFTVTLTVTNLAGAKESSAQQLTILDFSDLLPVAAFQIEGGPFYAPETISFVNQSQRATSYEWDFGDGRPTLITTSDTTVFNEFLIPQDYVVSLKATNENGTVQSQQTITINQINTYKQALNTEFCDFSFPNRIEQIKLVSHPFGFGILPIYSFPNLLIFDNAGSAVDEFPIQVESIGNNEPDITDLISLNDNRYAIIFEETKVVCNPCPPGVRTFNGHKFQIFDQNDGTLLQEKVFDNIKQKPEELNELSNGNLLITFFDSTNNEVLFRELNTAGMVLNESTIPGITIDQPIVEVSLSPDETILWLATTTDLHYFVRNGSSILYVWTYDQIGRDIVSISPSSDNSEVVTLSFNGRRYFISRFDTEHFDVVGSSSQVPLGSAGDAKDGELIPLRNGNFLLMASYPGFVFLAERTNNLGEVWFSSLENIGTGAVMRGVIQAQDGGFIVTGDNAETDPTCYYAVKTDKFGKIIE